jgi:hypothetical protein
MDDMTLQAVTISNGDLMLDAASADLNLQGNITASNNITMVSGDVNFNNAEAETVAIGTVTIADQAIGGNGIGLGALQTNKLNLGTSELLSITSAGVILQSSNGITLVGDLNATNMISPLTISTNTFGISDGAKITLGGGLDFADTIVTILGAFTIDIAGAFAMNGAISTTGAVVIDAGMGILMGAPASISTTNDAITMTSGINNINLGLLYAGAAEVSLTATGGDILNNNGVFADITQSLTNIQAGSAALVATSRIGVSSLNPITLDIDPNNAISLTFGAANAYINNLQNSQIINNSQGIVVVGLTFDSQIIGIGQNIGSGFNGSLSQLNENKYAQLLSDDSPILVLGANSETLFGEDDEDVIVSTIIPSVPVLVLGNDGWEFVALTRRQILDKIKQNQKRGVKYLDWL